MDASDSLLLQAPDDDADAAVGKPSRVRFYVLAQYCLFTIVQSIGWALPGALTEAFEDPAIYDVSPEVIVIWLGWGLLVFCLTAIPFAYWLDLPGGLRQSMLFSIGLVLAGCVIRSAVRDASPLSILALHLSYVLNAAAGPVSMGAVGKISEDFFPPRERASATAWASEANPFGAAIAYLFCPAMVMVIDMAHVQSVNTLLLVVTAFNFISCAIYLPSHPPAAPSASAGSQRAAEARFSLRVLRDALGSLGRSRAFVLLCGAYGLSAGFSSCWASTLQTNLTPFLAGSSAADVQWKAGIISFASTTAGNLGGVVLGSYIDRFRGHKALLVGLNGLGAAFFAVFALVASGAVRVPGGAGYSALFASALLGGLFTNAAIPIYFELAMEAAFPLPSGTVITVLTFMMNFAGLAFYAVPTNNSSGSWMTWALVGVLAAISVALFFLFEDKAARTVFDARAAAARGDLASLTSAERALLEAAADKAPSGGE